MVNVLSQLNNGVSVGDYGQFSSSVPIASDASRDEIVTACADGNQIVFDGFVRDMGIAARPVVNLQAISAAVFVTEAAAIAIKDKAGGPLVSPVNGSDVVFISQTTALLTLLQRQNPVHLASRNLSRVAAVGPDTQGIICDKIKRPPTLDGLIIAEAR